ncbi:MAG TPA: prolyl oligopeptidase family serine peptidase, partial [Saprospiraceae bacterium]|nr:prolyl oligopeptidase family serine peptidase [Saprospiraceae bacterium]
ENSPVYFAGRLKGAYLLVHGMSDDNVHFQHTAEMANALINANKQFETYFYPNRNHGIYGGNARLHLYTKMTAFLDANLKPAGKAQREPAQQPVNPRLRKAPMGQKLPAQAPVKE